MEQVQYDTKYSIFLIIWIYFRFITLNNLLLRNNKQSYELTGVIFITLLFGIAIWTDLIQKRIQYQIS